MVGDITGRSWAALAPSKAAVTSVVIANKNSSLFSDLVGSSLGIGKGNSSSVPLKNVALVSSQAASKSTYSTAIWRIRCPNLAVSQSLGGMSMKSLTVSGGGGGVSANKDPFGSLVDFSSKPAGMKAGSKMAALITSRDDAHGTFENALKPSFTGSGIGGSQSKLNDFGSGSMQSQPPPVTLPRGFKSDIGEGGGDVGGITELEGLPPPPAGVTSSLTKNKGMDNYKAGQYPDAIKWLSWAVILLEKAGDNAGTMEVLSSRSSCYKEVGEFKKAVADYSKVLEQDGKNVVVLVQRALLYESMEKYKLGAEDLRTVMNIDPGNKVARITIHRLTKLAS
ncbi:putative tetratricopeptide-like helical domain superfamily [Helianthus debilis subsp. tardiflorus]